MKKYLFFIVSFTLFFSVVTLLVQLFSGLFLTIGYVPNINEAWNTSSILSREVDMISKGIPFLITLLLAVLSATFAYFIIQKLEKRNYDKV